MWFRRLEEVWSKLVITPEACPLFGISLTKGLQFGPGPLGHPHGQRAWRAGDDFPGSIDEPPTEPTRDRTRMVTGKGHLLAGPVAGSGI
jgi:hypothetical protein